jgi:hypothetical protein
MSPEDQTQFVAQNWNVLQRLVEERCGPPPVELLDLEDSTNAIWMLKEAQWDNMSVSSEAERLELETRVGKGQADADYINDKIKKLGYDVVDDDGSSVAGDDAVDGGYYDDDYDSDV